MERENKIATIVLLAVCLTPVVWYQYESWRQDRTEKLTDLMSPVHKRITTYYQEYKRPPTLEESTRFVEDAGCKMTEYIDFGIPLGTDRSISTYCLLKGERVWVRVDYEIQNTNYPYSMSFNLMKTQCDFSIEANEVNHNLSVRKISCRNAPLISLRQ